MSPKDDIREILFSEEDIRNRSKELGEQITKDYLRMGRKPLLVALLRGSVPFLTDLMKNIDLDIQYDFMVVSSYSGTKSTGDIRILKDLDTNIEGKDILLVEDIVDTGQTVVAVKGMLKNKGASSVKVATLLNKPSRRLMEVEPEYIGFDVEDLFVVGYGMDYEQRYRTLPFVGVLKDEIYMK